MLPDYQANTDVTVSIAVPTVDGSPLPNVSAVEYAVFDETGSVVIARQNLVGYQQDDANAVVTVSAANNALSAGVTRAARRVEVYLTNPAGEWTIKSRYMITAINRLSVLSNSFVTYEEAMITASSMLDVDSFVASTEEQQIAALVSAHIRLCRLNYRFRVVGDTDRIDTGWFDPYERDQYGGIYTLITDITQTTEADWNDKYPEDFKRSLRRAQVREANVILSGDPVGDLRTEGIISQTIGESKVFLRPVPPIRTPVARETLSELSGYIYRRALVRRG